MWPNSQESMDLVTFTEEILNGKLLFFFATLYLRCLDWFSVAGTQKNLSEFMNLFAQKVTVSKTRF